MKMAYNSGNINRKRKSLLDEQIKLLPKVDMFLTPTKSTSISGQIGFKEEYNAIPTQETLDCLPSPHSSGIEHVGEKEEELGSITLRENDVGSWNKLSEDDISFWINEGPS